jgi:hypothetical protein
MDAAHPGIIADRLRGAMSKKKIQTPEEVARHLATSVLPDAKQEIEMTGDGGFIAKAFIRLPDGRTDILVLPWKDQAEKEAMSAALREHVRLHRALAFVVATDSWYRRIPRGQEQEWRRKYAQVREDPERIESLMLYLHWSGGSTIWNYPYDRIEGKVIWREEEATDVSAGEVPGRVVTSRFNPSSGKN